MRVRVDLNVSLDGFATTTDGTPDNPFSEDWARLVGPYTQTRTFRSVVLGDTTGEGSTGIDEKYAASYFEGVGAEIMGAGMFGLHLHPNDPDWRGWWGPNPPFHMPVFVLTHEPRQSLEMEGGTVFHFVAAAPGEVLANATKIADGKDVRIGGGPSVVREFLKLGFVDVMHLAIAPLVLGSGIRIWDDQRGLELTHEVASEVAESGVVHVTFTRRAPRP